MKRKKVAKPKIKHNAKKVITEDIYQYTAVFEPAIEGGFNVSFPALPGCFTCGDNLSHAKKMAKEVLGLWIEELLSEKEYPPLKDKKPIIQKISAKVQKS